MSAGVASKVTLLGGIAALAVAVAVSVSALVPLDQMRQERDEAVAALAVSVEGERAAETARDACMASAAEWQLSAVAFAVQLAAGTNDITDGNDHANAAEAAGCVLLP